MLAAHGARRMRAGWLPSPEVGCLFETGFIAVRCQVAEMGGALFHIPNIGSYAEHKGVMGAPLAYLGIMREARLMPLLPYSDSGTAA